MKSHNAGSWLTGVLLAAACTFTFGCSGAQQPSPVGVNANVQRGKKLIIAAGCGSCHTVPGIYRARGMVGPPLYFFSRRTMVAGELPNTPDNLVRWIQHPQSIEPKTAMPDLGLSEQQARDIAAYLYTLR